MKAIEDAKTSRQPAVPGTRRMTVATAIIEFLKVQYVRRDGREHRLINGIGGIFGHGNVAGLGMALEESGGRELPFYQPKNEQAMVHTAAAFAKARHRLGTLACTSSVGPGATNMVTGAAGATINRMPVLLLPGDVFANRIPEPVLQKLEHPLGPDVSVNDCFRPVSRYFDRIQRPEQILRSLPEAMRVLADPAETGAVTICLPQDVQAEALDVPSAFLEKRVYEVPRVHCPSSAIAEAADLVKSAKKPLIVAGGGVHYSEATAALAAFCKHTGIPVAVTQAGVGALTEDHPSLLGSIGATGNLAANRIAAEADLVLAIGTRLSDFTTASKTQFQHPEVRFIGVNVHSADAHKHRGLALVGDARAALEDLGNALKNWMVARGYEREIAAARKDWDAVYRSLVFPDTAKDGRLTQASTIRVVNEEAGLMATVVHAAGGLPGDLHKLWKPRTNDDYHSEYGYSCMGYEIAGAVGVKLARPEREVFALLGDGSYLMMSQELATAVQEGLKITVMLVDNGGYQCIHGLQRSVGGESFGNEFRRRDPATGRLDGEPLAIDFCANAQSLGATVFRAETEAKLREAMAKSRAAKGTCLIYIPVRAEGLPGSSWWDVPVAEMSDKPSAQKARKSYVQAKKAQRYHD